MVAPASSTLSFALTRSDSQLRDLFTSIASTPDLADLLEVPYGHLNFILYKSPARYPYRRFTIPKRSGAPRQISAPPPAIMALQTKLNHILQLIYQPRPCAQGFILGRSILSNASLHTSKRFVLNIDLADFFPSINVARIRGLFMAPPYGLDPNVATVIAQLCTYDDTLPQGAPTSPIISNMICSRLA